LDAPRAREAGDAAPPPRSHSDGRDPRRDQERRDVGGRGVQEDEDPARARALAAELPPPPREREGILGHAQGDGALTRAGSGKEEAGNRPASFLPSCAPAPASYFLLPASFAMYGPSRPYPSFR